MGNKLKMTLFVSVLLTIPLAACNKDDAAGRVKSQTAAMPVKETAFEEKSAPPKPAPNLLASAASVTANQNPGEVSKLYDGSTNVGWKTNTAENVSGIVNVDFGSEKSFDKYSLMNLVGAASFNVQYSSDGNQWTDLPAEASAATNNIKLFDEVKARYVKLTVHGTASKMPVALGEFSLEMIKDIEAEKKNIERILDPEKYKLLDLQYSLRNDIVLLAGSSRALVNGRIVTIDPTNVSVKPVTKNGSTFVPVRFIAEALGANVGWNESTGVVEIKTAKKQTTLKLNEKTIVENGKSSKMDASVQIIEGTVMVPLKAVSVTFGKQIYTEKRGLIMIGDQVENRYDEAKDAEKITDVTNMIVLERPTPKKIMADFTANNPAMVHPRLFKTKDELEKILALKDTDKFYAESLKGVMGGANAKLTADIPLDGNPQFYRNITQMTAAYVFTKDERYANRLWDILEKKANQIAWGKESLELSYTAKAFAVAYDWMYDYWSDEQKQILSTAIREKCLKLYLDAYNGRPSSLANGVTGENNINTTGNSAAMMGALAIYETDPAFAADVIAHALRKVEKSIVQVQPEGAWGEGPYYWYYTVNSAIQFMSVLDSALGTNYGFSDMPGMSQTGYFIIYSNGPKGKFNFHDGTEDKSFTTYAELLWLAHKNKDAALGGMRKRVIMQTGGGTFEDLIWYDPEYADVNVNLPPDRVFARTESGGFNSAWNDPNSMYLGFKGGHNTETHGDLNIGTFVLDAGGERWVSQLGLDDYNLPGYWSYGPGGKRYKYYRKRAEGNNTLIVNPGPGEDMNPNAFAKIERFESSKGTAFSIIDTTQAYKGVSGSKRGFMMTCDRSRAIIQDEVHLNNNGEMWWFAHTKAKITISNDGRSAILKMNGKRMAVYLSGGKGLTFMQMPAAPLPTSPNPEMQNKNEGFVKLAIHGQAQKDYEFAVSFALLNNGEQSGGKNDTFVPLKEWIIK
ncbi:stalk domain-containing protein [Paenibacillus filicis]|uniref:Stalk domain-containing protein n=1 Tax=Paenibacillus gyeongsangnamensis TaxID=3388067 RepID=A0ABT4Q263_9BACL|nr:stalk domain-containing protein [Paenibacillus filicis]MCZ8510972.1 stalk domain-containing protein [Paenibacillus filicis]